MLTSQIEYILLKTLYGSFQDKCHQWWDICSKFRNGPSAFYFDLPLLDCIIFLCSDTEKIVQRIFLKIFPVLCESV